MIVMLWANEIFDRERPDTVACQGEPVKKLKVVTVVGTRPEIIRLSRVIAACWIDIAITCWCIPGRTTTTN